MTLRVVVRLAFFFVVVGRLAAAASVFVLADCLVAAAVRAVAGCASAEETWVIAATKRETHVATTATGEVVRAMPVRLPAGHEDPMSPYEMLMRVLCAHQQQRVDNGTSEP